MGHFVRDLLASDQEMGSSLDLPYPGEEDEGSNK
jgi:hypothetical protein